MTACGAEFGWSETGGVVCRLAVHDGDHEALIHGAGAEYDGGEHRVIARVRWPQVKDADSEHASGPQSDAQGGAGGRVHRDAARPGERQQCDPEEEA